MPHILRARTTGPINQTGWFNIGDTYSAADIATIEDQNGANTSVLLTSIPSPFARIHLFLTAFEMVNQAQNHVGVPDPIRGGQQPTKYHIMVSQCFDFLEFFYRFDHFQANLQANGFVFECHKIVLKNDNPNLPASHIQQLIGSNNAQHQLLGRTLNTFFKSDFNADAANANFAHFNDCFVFTINNEVIGGTSPMTLFFGVDNIQNVLPDANNLTSLDGLQLFSNVSRPLHTREVAFQQYIHNLFIAHNNIGINQLLPAMFRYIQDSRANIVNGQAINNLYNNLNPGLYNQLYPNIVNINGNQLNIMTINGFALSVNQQLPLVANNLMSDFLITGPNNRIALLLSYDNMPVNTNLTNNIRVTPSHSQVIHNNARAMIGLQIAQRTIPISGMVFPCLVANDFLEANIIVLQNAPNCGNTFFQGKPLIDINDDNAIARYNNHNFILPIKEEYFNYFSIDDLKRQFKIEIDANGNVTASLNIRVSGGFDLLLKMTYNGDKIHTLDASRNQKMGISIYPFIKSSIPDFNNDYKIFNHVERAVINDNALNLTFYNIVGGIRNEIVPQNITNRLGNQNRKIDIYSVNSEFDSLRVSIGDLSGLIIPIWHEPIIVNNQDQLYAAIDFGTTNSHIEVKLGGGNSMPLTHQNLTANFGVIDDDLFKNVYFIPEINDGPNPMFSFPTRSALNHNPGNVIGTFYLSQANIAFFYGKQFEPNASNISKNLKWDLIGQDEEKAKAYIYQMMFMLRNYAISIGIDPRTAIVSWFLPSSMPVWQKGVYVNMWQNLYNNIFLPTIPDHGKLRFVSESEAPYYYYAINQRNHRSILCIDIGGGTTDIVLFENQIPTYESSYRFGANTMFDLGFNINIDGQVNNVLFTYFKGEITTNINNHIANNATDAVYASINENLINTNNSVEIINFWLANRSITKFDRLLMANHQLKFIFVFYYTALVYHIAQTLRYQNSPCPSQIYFSGNGSLTLNILDEGINGQRMLLNNLTKRILNAVNGDNYANGLVAVNIAADPKRATAKGGNTFAQYGRAQNVAQPHFFALIGANNNSITTDFVSYAQLNADNEIKELVKQNVLDFISMIEQIGFNDFNITFNNYRAINEMLNDSFDGYIDRGLAEHISTNPNAPVNESLFFYPIKGLLFDIQQLLVANPQ